MLAWTIYSSFIGAGLLMVLDPARKQAARFLALATAMVGFGIALAGFIQYQPPGDGDFGTVRTISNIPWISTLGLRYFLAADGISLTLVLLTGLAAVAGILFSWNIEYRVKEFFTFYLTLIGGVYGVFLSFDLFLLFVFYEIAIIPKYFLIAIWGSTRKEYGAMKLALYSFAGSAMVLVGLLAAYVKSSARTLSIVDLAAFPFPESFQIWVFPLIFIGFGILAGLWPLHTWAPTGHVAAPTGASMLLAGVVMKLGAYGALRVGMTLFPAGAQAWQYPMATLAVIGIVYGAMVALVQKDFKFVIGYSSVSHMGFVLLGLMTLNKTGISGAVLQMFSHGVIAGLLFAVVGRMVYERSHTRDLDELQGMDLGRVLPFASVTFVLAGAASMGVPGFSGFVAELQVLIGAWRAFPVMALLGGAGVFLGVVFTLRAIQKSFFGEHRNAGSESGNQHELPPITLPEKAGAVILLAATIVIGLCPNLLLNIIMPSLNAPWMQGLLRGGRP